MKAQIQICMGADVEQIRETLSEGSRKNSTLEGWIVEGLTFFELFRLWNLSTDVDAKISTVRSRLHDSQDPHPFFYLGLLYQHKGEEDLSYVYMDSVRVVIENRVAKARSDTTGRFEIFDLSHNMYDFLAVAYSQTNRHELAIDHAQLAIESMTIEACHW